MKNVQARTWRNKDEVTIYFKNHAIYIGDYYGRSQIGDNTVLSMGSLTKAIKELADEQDSDAANTRRLV